MPKLKIKLSNDVRTAEKLHNKTLDGVPFDFESCSLLWLAYIDDIPVGFATAKQREDYWFMSGCGVLEEYRGNGIQKKLIKARESKARKLQVPKLITYTVHDNPPSMNSLISQGFKLYIPEWRYVGDNMCYWVKYLSK